MSNEKQNDPYIKDTNIDEEQLCACTAETSMRKEEDNSANVFLALACDDDEVDDDVNLQTMNDVDDHEFEEIVVGDELTLPKLHKSSHDVVAGGFKEYCQIIAKMKSSHDPKMSIVSNMFSNMYVPPLIKNQAAHSVKSDVCKIGGTAEDKAHMGAGRHGGKNRQNMHIRDQRDGIKRAGPAET